MFTWGINSFGKLGDGTNEPRFLPVDITMNFDLITDEKIEKVFMLEFNSVAITSLGRVFVWGYNAYGQLGDGTTVTSYIPIDITERLELGQEEDVLKVFYYGYSNESIFILTSQGRVLQLNKDGVNDIRSSFDIDEDEVLLDVFVPNKIAFTSKGKVLACTEVDNKVPFTREYRYVEINRLFNLDYNESIVKVFAENGIYTAITSKGKIMTWGMGATGYPLTFSVPTLSSFNSVYASLFDFYNYEENIDLFIPERDGYVFDGWYIDAELTVPFELTSMPAESIVLYARWIKI